MALAGANCGPAQPDSPNIVFLMADDLGYGDLGCYGQAILETPNLDRLASEGLRFSQAYAGGPVCTPSRSVLMTGLHNGHTPARDNIPHYETYLQEDDITVAKVLRSAGYRCGGVGKWSLGDAGTVGRATNQGFDTWFGYLNQDHAHYYYPDYLDDGEKRLDLPGNHVNRKYYSHDLMVDRALEFIREAKQGPFFFYGAFTLPHFSAPDEDPDGLTVPSTGPYSDRDWDERSKKYAAMVKMLDRDVGRIVDLIDTLGLRDNTLIIFTSDNGGHDNVWEEFDTNGPLRGHKRNLSEGGIRVPMIARWPGRVPAGKTSDEVVAFQDMLPTCAEIARAEVPANLDGISITQALWGNTIGSSRGYLYWDYGHCRSRYDQAVRIGNWKGLREGRGGRIQLFDLSEDIEELNDLSAEYPSVVAQMDEIMRVASTPSERYPIGEKYSGSAIWKKSW